MKTINIIRTLILSGIIGICSSCIEDYKYEEVTGAPQVAFSTSETEFTNNQEAFFHSRLSSLMGRM